MITSQKLINLLIPTAQSTIRLGSIPTTSAGVYYYYFEVHFVPPCLSPMAYPAMRIPLFVSS